MLLHLSPLELNTSAVVEMATIVDEKYQAANRGLKKGRSSRIHKVGPNRRDHPCFVAQRPACHLEGRPPCRPGRAEAGPSKRV